MRLVEKVLSIADRKAPSENRVTDKGGTKRAGRVLQHAQNRLEQRQRRKNRRQERQSPMQKMLAKIDRRRQNLGGGISNG